MKILNSLRRALAILRGQRIEISLVTDNEVVITIRHRAGTNVFRHENLLAGHSYVLNGISVRTLPRPQGELLCRFTTVNDVHFGETECGNIEQINLGAPVRGPVNGRPYPVVMNEAAAEEMLAIAPDAVIVKGDITDCGKSEQFEQFRQCYGIFGSRLWDLPGNHDVTTGADPYDRERLPKVVELPGVTLALLDTTIGQHEGGQITAAQLRWLDGVAGSTSSPVLVFGHHPVYRRRASLLFGQHYLINAQDSRKFKQIFARHSNLCGYFAGHTHRNHVARFRETGSVPFVEVASTKEWPAMWAEYRVYEGGILQINHRINRPDALGWAELTRAKMLPRLHGLYAMFALGRLKYRSFSISTQSQKNA